MAKSNVRSIRPSKGKTHRAQQLGKLSVDTRIQIMKLRADGKTWDEIAEATGITPRALQRWYDAYASKQLADTDDMPESPIEAALNWDREVEIEGEDREEFNARRALLAASYLLHFTTDGFASQMTRDEVTQAVACVLDDAAFALRSSSHSRQVANRLRQRHAGR